MHIWWILYEKDFPCFLARKWWRNKLLLLKSIGKWRDICNSNHDVYIFCLLNVITKMLNTFFGELYLIVNNRSDHKNMRNRRVCPQVMNKKNYICFQCYYVDFVVFNAAYREYFTQITLRAVIFENFLMATEFFLHCAFQKTHHPNTKFFPAITRDFHSFYAENVIAKHKEWCSVNTTVNSMLRLHFYF